VKYYYHNYPPDDVRCVERLERKPELKQATPSGFHRSNTRREYRFSHFHTTKNIYDWWEPDMESMSPISDTPTLGLFYSDIGGENLVVTKASYSDIELESLSTILADSDIGLETISTLKFFSSVGITQNSSNPILKTFRPCLFPLDQDDDRHRISMVILIRYSS
jgi:hypothetical protein